VGKFVKNQPIVQLVQHSVDPVNQQFQNLRGTFFPEVNPGTSAATNLTFTGSNLNLDPAIQAVQNVANAAVITVPTQKDRRSHWRRFRQ
jgi:hypothetical protein